MTTVQSTEWGPLSEPIHTDIEGERPWRDNAFLAFWDPERDLVGTLHTSTSPNAEGRRARFSVQTGGKTIELIEDLEPGTFSSESISFEAGASFSIDTARVSGSLTTAPQDRRSVVTEVMPFDRQRVKLAILRELQREGQVYFVHNRVHNIRDIAAKIQSIVPDYPAASGDGER